MRDQYHCQKQLSEIIRKPGESVQEFCGRVVILANNAYQLSPSESEKYGVEAIIKGCNLESVQLVAVTNGWKAAPLMKQLIW